MSNTREQLIQMIEKIPEDQLQNVLNILTSMQNMIAPEEEPEEEASPSSLTPQELAEGIRNIVSTLKTVGSSDEFIISQLMERYGISKEDAREQLSRIDAYTI